MCKANATSAVCSQEGDCDRRRRKREVAIDDDEKPVEEITVMTSRLTFSERSCAEMNCPTFSICFDLSPPVCRCGESYVLDGRSGKCRRDQTFVVYGLHLDMEFNNDFLDPYSKAFTL